MKALNSLMISGAEALPIIEGGKGVSVSNGESAGAFAAAGAVGTFSAVNADSFDENGDVVPQIYHATKNWWLMPSRAVSRRPASPMTSPPVGGVST